MEFVIEQSKLKDMLDYLQVSSLFPFPRLTVKDGEVSSIQETPDHSIFRYVKFSKDYFDSLSEKTDFVTVDAQKIHKIISREDAKTKIKIQAKDGRLMIDTPNAHTELNLINTDVGARDELPFKIKKGVPIFKGDVPLDTCVHVDLPHFKNVVEFAKVLDTEFFKFMIDENKKMIAEIGDLEDYAETSKCNLPVKVDEFQGEQKVTLSKGVKELADTFTKKVGIRFKSDFPMWFFEASNNHKFGVLIAPHHKKKQK